LFDQTFKNIDDTLWKDAGCSSELDYIEQTSWILFLKYLDDLEEDRKKAAELSGRAYTPILSPKFRWDSWAVPRDEKGKIDLQQIRTGDDLLDFVNLNLFPYLRRFKKTAVSADTIEYKIGEIFSEVHNRLQNGYILRDVIDQIDTLHFCTHEEKYQMSVLYENKIKNMGNAGRNGGEYYTPRSLIKTIVRIITPRIGETIYDGAVGSAGFLVEAFEYLKRKKGLTAADMEILQKRTLYGKEKKSLAYIVGTMNMILHGIDAPNILHTNTLSEKQLDMQDEDCFDIVVANPPFGGKERAVVKQNFPIKTGETAFLFLQHFIKILKQGGRASVIIKNTFLSNTDKASINLRRYLLETCNLHTILALPGGVFPGSGVKTIVLFFTKGMATKKIWFYQLNLDRNLGKTEPLTEADLSDFIELQKTKAESPDSWTLDVDDVDKETFDISARNPNRRDEVIFREPLEIIDEIIALDDRSAELLLEIKKRI
jgi:type I restriction enzyme M protein